ncbi:MAG: hypothetical protein DHS20C18_15180 [Saprospiraceae bacterium]|nr:MAG: hypothetical protein DHS20C18_15180 [Saprospiraceae bacterium]
MLTENFAEAETCFAELEAIMPRDVGVYNNRGINQAMWGLSLLKKNEAEDLIEYVFPFAVAPDLNSKGNEDRILNIGRLFKSSEEYFQRCINLKSDFAEGYLNLACSQALLSRWNRDPSLLRSALGNVNIAKQKASKGSTTLGACLIVRGIIYDYLNNAEKRNENFSLASKHYELYPDINLASLAEQNQEVASGKSVVFANAKGEKYSIMEDEPEMIDGQQLSRLIRKPNMDVDTEVTTIGGARLFHKTYSESSLYIYFKNADHFVFFHRTSKGYTGKSGKGISVGDHEAHVIQAYGTPIRVWPALGGKYLFYQKAKLLFFINNKGVVKEWMVWRRKT